MGFQSTNKDEYKEFILKNPEVIIESVNNYHEAKNAQQMESASDFIAKNYKVIYEDSRDARVKKGSGKIKIVEFFDYSCGYCRKMFDVLEKAFKENDDIEIVYKEFPILSKRSYILAVASSVFYNLKPNDFLAFHKDLFYLAENVSKEDLADLALKHGADKQAFSEKFDSVMSDKKYFEPSMKLAMELGVQATPVTIVNNKMIPGYVNYEQFAEVIKSQY